MTSTHTHAHTHTAMASAGQQRRAWLQAGVCGALAISPLAAWSGVNLFNQTYDLSLDELQQHLQKRFPWRRSQRPLGTVVLTQPVLSLDPARNRLRLAMQVALTSVWMGDNAAFNGIANTSSALQYVAESRAIALDQPQVEQLEFADLPATAAQPLSRFAAVVVREVLHGTVIHTFKPNDLKVGWKAIEPTTLTVTSSGLTVGWRWA